MRWRTHHPSQRLASAMPIRIRIAIGSSDEQAAKQTACEAADHLSGEIGVQMAEFASLHPLAAFNPLMKVIKGACRGASATSSTRSTTSPSRPTSWRRAGARWWCASHRRPGELR